MSSVCARCLSRSYLDRIQESPTLDLVEDCLRFVAGYFEIISASSAHIYHSALVLAPKESIVRQIYASHARPFARVVRGAPTSWDPNTAAASRPSEIRLAVWSPCSRFIAIAWGDIPTIDVLDSVTLQRLQSFRTSLNGYLACDPLLAFSPDGHILTYHGIPGGDHELCVSSWDLQTGGLVSTIWLQGPGPGYHRPFITPSIAHSASGGIIGVFHWYLVSTYIINIFIFDVTSGACIHHHSFSQAHWLPCTIWTRKYIRTYGEAFRFATAHAATVTIWEVGFTLGATCKEVETLHIPVDLVHKNAFGYSSFLLAHTFGDMILLARRNGERIQVWDVRNLKCLLDCEGGMYDGPDSFSSNGRFIVCTARQSPTYNIWKESPTGYVLHRILQSNTRHTNPPLSPNGEAIITFQGLIIELWRTREITTPPSGARTPEYHQHFLLDFSPDGKLAVVTAQNGKTVTVLNLESGVPQLTIDAGMKVCGLRVIGNTVVVVGNGRVISWNLPAGDRVPDARVDSEDSAQTVDLSNFWNTSRVLSATISSDLRYVALMFPDRGLHIYNASTGEYLQTTKTWDDGHTVTLWFTPDGSHVWCVGTIGEAHVWRVGERGALERLELAADVEHPPEGYPWRSSRGYRVTNDWWILGPDGKRLLMLPPRWQSYPVYRVWKGKFLALLHNELPEAVILEMEP